MGAASRELIGENSPIERVVLGEDTIARLGAIPTPELLETRGEI